MQEERDSFKFKAYLVVSRVYEDEEEAATGSSKALSKQQKRPSGGKKVHPSLHSLLVEFVSMHGQQAAFLVGTRS